MPRVPRFLPPLLALLVSVLFIVALELMVRSLVDERRLTPECWAPGWCTRPTSALVRDPVLHFSHRPNLELHVPLGGHPEGGFSFRTNHLGLRRDTPVAVPKPPGVFRILLLGDSQTEGWVNNQESYAFHLERMLNAAGRGRTFEVLNAGVSGYSPAHELLWYRERGVELQPDLVILGFYPGNDLWDLMDTSVIVDGVDVTETSRLRGGIRALQNSLFEHSRLYEALYWATRRQPPPEPSTVRAFRDVCGGCWSQYLAQVVAIRDRGAEADLAQVRFAAIASRLVAETSAHGSRAALLSIPIRLAIEPAEDAALLAQGEQLLGLRPEDLGTTKARVDASLSAARSAGLTVLDPQGPFAALAGGERLYYQQDWHLTPHGHQRFAAVVARLLVETGFIP